MAPEGNSGGSNRPLGEPDFEWPLLAPEGNSGGSNRPLGEPDFEWPLRYGDELFQPNEIGHEIEALGAFYRFRSRAPSAEEAAAAAAGVRDFLYKYETYRGSLAGRGRSNVAEAIIQDIVDESGSSLGRGGHAAEGQLTSLFRAANRGHNGLQAVLDEESGSLNFNDFNRPAEAITRLNVLRAQLRAIIGLGYILVEASPGLTVLGREGHAIGGQLRALLRAIIGHNANGFNIPGEASPGLTVLGREGHANGGQLNGDILHQAIRGHTGYQAVLVDATGGRYLAIHINPPQQADQGLEAPGFRAENSGGNIAQRGLQSAFGGLVPLCLAALDGVLKDGSPGYIKAIAYAVLALITVFTFIGLVSKKRANAAIRVVASTAIAAASTAIVYKVSDNVYIKCVCGIIGAVATLATAAINW